MSTHDDALMSAMTETSPARRAVRDIALGELSDALVMIIDDEPLVIELTEAFLQGAGYRRFASSTDPASAIASLLRERPDVVLLDINMPKVSGFDLLARMQADPVLKQYNLSLGITGKEDDWRVRILGEGSGDFTAGKYSLGANAGVGYTGKVGTIPFKFDATAGVGGSWQDQSKLPPDALMGRPASGLDGKVEAKVWVGISVPTPFQF